jgi:sugar phosphate isomerase/epimerase
VPATKSAETAATLKKANIKRGVSLYSYIGDFGSSMTLEDCLLEFQDMGCHGVEILSEAHVPDYPNPSNAWVDHWYRMFDKYNVQPAYYSSWLDDEVGPEENVEVLLRDMRLAQRLGFKAMRPKIAGSRHRPAPGARPGPGFGYLVDPKWEEWVLKCLPYAEKLNVKFAPEIATGSIKTGPVIHDLVAFCEKYKPEYFGIHIDTWLFSTKPARLEDVAFQTDQDEEKLLKNQRGGGAMGGIGGKSPNAPRDILLILPYVIHFHLKFTEMSDDYTEYNMPFADLFAALKEGGYNGWVCSEYDGPRDRGLASFQVRRQHVMLKRLLGEYQNI